MQSMTKEKIIYLHRRLLEQSGGLEGIRDHGALESALAQPQMAFGGSDLYETLQEKAAALGYSLIMNHPFVDGNKRVGHAAMDVFLEMNGHRIAASVDEGEQMILALAAGQSSREQLVEWLKKHIVPLA